MKYLLLGLIQISLISCSQLPKPVNGWIEIPLSEGAFRESSVAYEEGVHEIVVEANTALEYQVALNKDDVIVYKWQVNMQDLSLLDVEFHGHTERVDGEPGLLIFYKVHNEGQGKGSLVSPFTGVHGWYFNNHSDEDIVIKLSISGFYTELDP